jgi:uncharacterized protein with FMN-binding domain
MIAARTARLIVRSVTTALVVAVVAVLVVIYLRSEGNGAGALTPVRKASASNTGGVQASGGNAVSGGSGGSGSGTCEPPRVCGSESTAGSSGTAHGSSAPVTYTGSVAENPYGPVQVSVTEKGGKIVDVKALQMPTEHQFSAEISRQVAPMLRTEALQAQNAEIAVISGATYTSESYASSLQAALRQGNLHR